MSEHQAQTFVKKIKAWYNNNLSVKFMTIILLLLIFTCGAFAGSGMIINKELTNKLREQIDLRLSTDIQIAYQTVMVVPGFDSPFESKQSPQYIEIKKLLEKLKKDFGLENVFMLSNYGGNERILILSDEPNDFGTSYSFTSEMQQALSDNRTVLSDIYEDEYGIHKSIFLPIKNSQGANHTLLGIDLDASVIPKTTAEIAWTTGIITVVVLVVGTVISRIMVRPLRKLMLAANRMSSGDLRDLLEANRQDEIGKLISSFGVMNENLQYLIRQISSTSEQISTTSQTLHHSARETSEMSAGISISMNKMSDGIVQVVDGIVNSNTTIGTLSDDLNKMSYEVEEMNETTRLVNSQSVKGQQMVEQALQQMEVLRGVMLQSQEAATGLGERSREIGEIINIITNISQQTNLLALNAEIEAARVGEKGKGFAVIASEVRKLAEQSANSAKSIASLITSTQENSSQVIKRITEGYHAVEQGHSSISGTYDNFKTIQKGISDCSMKMNQLSDTLFGFKPSFANLSETMEQISGVTQEQAAGFEEVAGVIEQQSISVSEVTNTIGELSDLSQELQNSITKFILPDQ